MCQLKLQISPRIQLIIIVKKKNQAQKKVKVLYQGKKRNQEFKVYSNFKWEKCQKGMNFQKSGRKKYEFQKCHLNRKLVVDF